MVEVRVVTDVFNSGVCLHRNIVKKCVPGQDEWVEASVYKGISAKVSAIQCMNAALLHRQQLRMRFRRSARQQV